MNGQTEKPEGLLSEEDLRKHSIFAGVMGILLVVVGALALGVSATVSLVSMVFIGWLMVIGGVIQGIHAFSRERHHHTLLKIVLATLYVIVGILMLANPLAAEFAVTLLLIAFFLVAGVSRIAAAVRESMENRWAILASGIISLLLGILLWAGWPITGLFAIGVFVGVDLIVEGWTLLMLAIAVRHIMPHEVPHAP